MPRASSEELQKIVAAAELVPGRDVILAGYIDDELLIRLYNRCEVFIFHRPMRALEYRP